jgi:hypothetical protein
LPFCEPFCKIPANLGLRLSDWLSIRPGRRRSTFVPPMDGGSSGHPGESANESG